METTCEEAPVFQTAAQGTERHLSPPSWPAKAGYPRLFNKGFGDIAHRIIS